ncbi:MAG: hypothetical protein AAF633_01265 [Chloroflexota bacterium]
MQRPRIKKEFRFDPVDKELIRLKFSIPAEKRLQAMLASRQVLGGGDP